MTATVLATKAEVVLASQLVLRHRTPRLAGFLVLVLTALWFVRSKEDATLPPDSRTVLLIAGTLAAAAGSRLAAPGGALACAYRVAGPWWMVPVGRTIGSMLVTLPLVFVGVLVLGAPISALSGLCGLAIVTLVYTAVTTSCVLGCTPMLGSSAAATLGLAGTWFGAIPPSAVHVALAKWSVVQGPVVLLWNLLPLNWRAARLIARPGYSDSVVLLGWLLLGVGGAAWAIGAAHRAHRPPAEILP
jgi:hypothetical protein